MGGAATVQNVGHLHAGALALLEHLMVENFRAAVEQNLGLLHAGTLALVQSLRLGFVLVCSITPVLVTQHVCV